MHDTSKDSNIKLILKASYGLVLFGVPNHGLRNEQLRAMVEDKPSKQLVHDLVVDKDEEATPLLKELASKFFKCSRQQDFGILSFYEREKSGTYVVSRNSHVTQPAYNFFCRSRGREIGQRPVPKLYALPKILQQRLAFPMTYIKRYHSEPITQDLSNLTGSGIPITQI